MKIIYKIFFIEVIFLTVLAKPVKSQDKELYSLKEECTKSLLILSDDILKLQNTDSSSSYYGALYCKACNDFHTRASESVLPLAAAFKQSGEKKYLDAAVSTGEWLIKQQLADGSWVETPSEWQGTTTDQLLSMSTAFSIIRSYLDEDQQPRWKTSVKRAADWLVKNMNPDYASNNYCATTTASLMLAFNVVPDSAYVKKAKELAMLVLPKFDEDFFLTGEGNRVRSAKYGVDLGYNMDMSLWGLGLYAGLSGDTLTNYYVLESLKRCVHFVYPDGSIDNSWGVRSSKWTTFGSFTADGSQVLFSLYSKNNPVFRKAALANLHYLMKMRVGGLITYGPDYYDIFNSPPCIYPTFCRAKNLALAVLYGDDSKGTLEDLPSEKTGTAVYFKTINTALVRTENFMATVTGYQYKDIRRGADFKYMFRPSGGSITNLWVKDYGFLQASGQTEYHQWEMNYPEPDSFITITPRIEFTDSDAYYTSLYEFDSYMEINNEDGSISVRSTGELKDRNRWEGGVAYVLINKIAGDYVEKSVKLRFHGQKPAVKIIEPFIRNKNTRFEKVNDQAIKITDGKNVFLFELAGSKFTVEPGENSDYYEQPFPSLKAFPLVINVTPGKDSFEEKINYRITLVKN
jgi:hypothetical protein